ncbi:MAG: cupin domain-containing protein [Syntrophales bacterium]|nr:cupin domain-containing protein [Syntrophales bacterium]
MKRLIAGFCLILLLTGNAWAGEGETVVTHVLSKTSESWNGSPLPPYPADTPEITILRIEIPPGAVLPMHSHPVINAGVLLRGELTVVTDEGSILNLKSGEAIVEVVDTWHYGTNKGSETSEIIVFYAGVAGKPITVLHRDE